MTAGSVLSEHESATSGTVDVVVHEEEDGRGAELEEQAAAADLAGMVWRWRSTSPPAARCLTISPNPAAASTCPSPPLAAAAAPRDHALAVLPLRAGDVVGHGAAALVRGLGGAARPPRSTPRPSAPRARAL